LRSLAAPLRDHTGTVIAAVNVSTSTAQYSARTVRRDVLPALLATAEAISADLGAISMTTL
jgi:IclR family transcriptional regulator, pca regulon regulatory protein